MTDYCKCKEKEIEEIERGEYICLNCEKEIEACDLGGEGDYDNETQEESDFYNRAGNEWAQQEAMH